MVAEELERNDIQQPLQAIHRLRDTDRASIRRDPIVALIAQNDRLGLTRRDLRKRALNLGVERILGHDDDHGHVLIDESKRTVLEFASKDTLRVHVADLLDLERTLKAGGVPKQEIVSYSGRKNGQERDSLVSTTHDQEGLVITDHGGQLLDFRVKIEDPLDLAGECVETVDDLLPPLAERDAILG